MGGSCRHAHQALRRVTGPRCCPAAPKRPWAPSCAASYEEHLAEGLSLAPGTAGCGWEVCGVAVGADSYGFGLAIVRQHCGIW